MQSASNLWVLHECQIINNNIQENTNHSIYLYQTTDTVNVTNNWWGTTDQSAIANLFYDYYKDFNLGKVNFVPFLTAPNPQAPSMNTPIPTPDPSASPTLTPNTSPSASPTPTVPEFPIAATLTVLIAATMLAVFAYKRKPKQANAC